MERIKSLGRYQKAILIFMIIMLISFTFIYPVTISKKGFEYNDAILTQSQKNGTTVYSGKIKDQTATFTVYEDKTVKFQYGNKTYGPYTVKEDPTAVPNNNDIEKEYMSGVELYCKDEIIFRGGVLNYRDKYWLYDENGDFANLSITASLNNGSVINENGDMIDPMEPSVSVIFDLIYGPKLTHKGDYIAYFGGIFICVVTSVSILFADELFRWNLNFRIRNSKRAQPSDWEITSRYITWTVLPIMAMILFITGLQ